jgi:hypothetical protein
MRPRDLHPPESHADQATDANQFGYAEQPQSNWAAVKNHAALPTNHHACLRAASLNMTTDHCACANTSHCCLLDIDDTKPARAQHQVGSGAGVPV